MALSLDPVPFQDAIDAMVSRGIVLPDIYYSKAFQAVMRNYSFSVAGIASVSQLQQTLDSLTKVLETGQTFGTWKKETLANNLAITALPAHRLDNIFRTNVQSQYNRGRAVHIVEHQRERPYLMYSAINDNRVRADHLHWDGFIAKVKDKIWGLIYPPLKSNPYRCRCTVISLSERQAKQRMEKTPSTQLKRSRVEGLKEERKIGSDSTLTKQRDMQAGLKEGAKVYQDTIFNDYLKDLGVL